MDQLQLILKEKAAGTLSKAKDGYERIISYLLVGIVANIVVSPFLHFLLGDEGPVFRITFSGLLSVVVLVFICLLVVFFYWIKYRSMQVTVQSNNIRRTLADNLRRFRKGRIQELVFIAVIFAATFVLARLSSTYLGHGSFGDIFRKDILLAMLAGFGIMLFYMYRRSKAYGTAINELRQHLQELDEETKGEQI